MVFFVWFLLKNCGAIINGSHNKNCIKLLFWLINCSQIWMPFICFIHKNVCFLNVHWISFTVMKRCRIDDGAAWDSKTHHLFLFHTWSSPPFKSFISSLIHLHNVNKKNPKIVHGTINSFNSLSLWWWLQTYGFSIQNISLSLKRLHSPIFSKLWINKRTDFRNQLILWKRSNYNKALLRLW